MSIKRFKRSVLWKTPYSLLWLNSGFFSLFSACMNPDVSTCYRLSVLTSSSSWCFPQSSSWNWTRLWARSSSTPAAWLTWCDSRGRACTGYDWTPSSSSRAAHPRSTRSPPTQHTHTLDLPQTSLWHCVHFYTSLPKMKTLSAPPLHHWLYEYSWEGRRPAARLPERSYTSPARKETQPAFLLWLSWFIFY